MSTICKSFESNAWRKDLCSHCFKSKEEHENPMTIFDPSLDVTDLKRYHSPAAAILYTRNSLNSSLRSYTPRNADLQPRPSADNNIFSTEKEETQTKAPSPTSFDPLPPARNGILRKRSTVKDKRDVKFHEDIVQVIGFGGDEVFDSDEEDVQDEADTNSDDEDVEPLTEEERQIQMVTQKNTSFNSVSRNLLESDPNKPAVKGFVSHGVTRPGETNAGKVPLVTIRPFGKDPRPVGELRVNLVSPMRNGEVVAAEKVATKPDKEEPDENTVKSQKVTSFRNPVPESNCTNVSQPVKIVCTPSYSSSPELGSPKVPTPPLSPPLSPVSDSPRPSFVESVHNEIPTDESDEIYKTAQRERVSKPALTRKPPVLKEKPRIPIKPQSTAVVRQAKLSENSLSLSCSSLYVSSSANFTENNDIDKNLHKASSQRNIASLDLDKSLEDSERAKSPSVEADASKESNKSEATEPDKCDANHNLKPEKGAKEMDAVKRLDSLFSKDVLSTDTGNDLRSPKSKPAPLPPVDRLVPAEQPGTNLPEQLNPEPKSLESALNRGIPNSSAERKTSKAAFEALRASVAGSLELSRLQPPRSSTTKRQAPSPPVQNKTESTEPAPEPEILANSPEVETQEKNESPLDHIDEPPIITTYPPPESKGEISINKQLETPEVERNRPQRSSSASPQPRKTSFGVIVSFDPDAHEVYDSPHSRSVSLTRVDQSKDSPKPPSIRKLIKERATQLFNNNNNKTETCQGRLSRSELFALEGKKTKNRFSLRKLLGLKSESKAPDAKPQEPEPIYAKPRPEIIHPLDLRPGAVEIVASKPGVLTSETEVYESPRLNESWQDSSLSSKSSSASSPSSSSTKLSTGRPKPPPPPRVNSLGKSPTPCDSVTPVSRPSRPPPPRSTETQRSTATPSPENPESSSQYANLGDLRTNITPKKPERTASLRLANSTGSQGSAEEKQDGLHYDCVPIKTLRSPAVGKADETIADNDGYVVPLRMRANPFSAKNPNRHSLSSFIPVSMKEDTYSTPLTRSGRPSLRQSRVDLHVNLDDHYGVLTGVNFQALSRLLEQAGTKREVLPHLESLLRTKPKWCQLQLTTEPHQLRTRTGNELGAAVAKAKWEQHDVLLLIRQKENEAPKPKLPFEETCLVSFEDDVPGRVIWKGGLRHNTTIRANVDIYPPGKLLTLSTLGKILQDSDMDDALQTSLCCSLQLMHAFSWFADHGVTSSPFTCADQILFYADNPTVPPRILWIPLDHPDHPDYEPLSENQTSFTEAVSNLLQMLNPGSENLRLKFQAILSANPLRGLEKLKSFTEFNLFGPSEELLRTENKKDLEVFQKWLDLERAAFLNDLISARGLGSINLSLIEELNLSFLVSTTARKLLEASYI